MEKAQRSPGNGKSSPKWVRAAGLTLRTLCLAILLLVVLRVSYPQTETWDSAYETPGDLVRLILGVLVCLVILQEIFALPKDPSAARTWLFIGIPLLPLSIVFAIAIWR